MRRWPRSPTPSPPRWRYPRGDRVSATNDLASAPWPSASSGDTNQLNNLITQAETLRQTDGQFVNSCSDALNRPTPDRVRELVVAWGKLYPQFGTVGALDLVKCLNWPSGSAPQDPKNLKIPVLLLGVQNDPIVGNEGVAAVAATIINAGASSNRRVMWQGIGHGATIYSPCALPPVIGYLDSGNLPRHRHVLPRLTPRHRPPVYGALVAVPDSIRTGLLDLRMPSGPAPPRRAPRRCCVRCCGPIAILSVIHRSYVLGTNGYITDDFGPVYRAVVELQAWAGTSTTSTSTTSTRTTCIRRAARCCMAPFGYLPVDASRYWFIIINTVAIVVAAYFLLRLFNFTLSSVAAPALLLAMFCTETVTNTLVFTNINGCILLLRGAVLPVAARRQGQPRMVGGRRDRADPGGQTARWRRCCCCRC